MIMLTRIDELCELTDSEPSKVFHSKAIKNKVGFCSKYFYSFNQVREVSEKFGIKENQIHPVKNYSSQVDCVQDMGMLTLRWKQ